MAADRRGPAQTAADELDCVSRPGDLGRAWRLAQELPLAAAVAAARRLRPAWDPTRPVPGLLELLASTDQDAVTAASAALLHPPALRLHLPATPGRLEFSPSGRSLAIQTHHYWNPSPSGNWWLFDARTGARIRKYAARRWRRGGNWAHYTAVTDTGICGPVLPGRHGILADIGSRAYRRQLRYQRQYRDTGTVYGTILPCDGGFAVERRTGSPRSNEWPEQEVIFCGYDGQHAHDQSSVNLERSRLYDGASAGPRLLASEPASGLLAILYQGRLLLVHGRPGRVVASAYVATLGILAVSFCGPESLIMVHEARPPSPSSLSLWHRNGKDVELAARREIHLRRPEYWPPVFPWGPAVFREREELALTSGITSPYELRYLDTATLTDIGVTHRALTYHARVTASPDGRGYALYDGNGDNIVEVISDAYAARVALLAGKPLNKLTLADSATVNAALAAPDPYPGARPFLEPLAAVLHARFSAEITLGGHRPQAGAGDDIILGGS